MDHFAVGEGAGRLLAQKVELVEMAQVEPLGYALPYKALWRGGWRQLVDAKEGVALLCIYLHSVSTFRECVLLYSNSTRSVYNDFFKILASFKQYSVNSNVIV